MWRYLTAAFWAQPDLPGLGRLPLNLLAVIGVGVLGLANPGFWLLGLGAEAAFLFALATNQRFQKTVDAQDLSLTTTDAEQKRQALIQQLTPDARQRLTANEAKAKRILEVQRESQFSDFVLDSTRDALGRITWVYLKLLIARHRLLEQARLDTPGELEARINDLEHDLAGPGLSETMRTSKDATLEITRKRLATLQRRQQSLAEIDSDLTRTEAQMDLALENAAIQDQPTAIGSDLTLASHLLDGGLYGADAATVMDLDQAFAPSASTTAAHVGIQASAAKAQRNLEKL
jgi:hypothetical protein